MGRIYCRRRNKLAGWLITRLEECSKMPSQELESTSGYILPPKYKSLLSGF
jgi:hypothetical protein